MEIQVPRILKPRTDSYFLFGPRGTGKTTWLKQQYPAALWLDLLSPDTFRTYSAYPERLKELVYGNPKNKVVVIDEIQKVPDLLSVVHLLIEQKLGVQFVLTGSSARKLKRTGVDLLAGRAVRQTLHPFIATELGNKYDFDKALQHGLLPLVYFSQTPDDVLKTYIALYIREEVQAEGLVRNIGNFSRFLEAISFSHGAVLNISNVARECEVERKVVEGYISILEDLLLSYRLPVFTKRAQRGTVCHPKFYFFDTGVYRALRPAGPLDNPDAITGTALEGLVAQHLSAWADYNNNDTHLYFWRTKDGDEVDFVVYGKSMLYAIEVKNTGRVRNEDLSSLKMFLRNYPEATAVFLYRGKERLKVNNVLCIPLTDFLQSLVPGKIEITGIK
ncbi:MAG: AAA family ATPase [Elusimicrobiota bacterium]